MTAGPSPAGDGGSSFFMSSCERRARLLRVLAGLCTCRVG
jgi:hypothetical protein